MQNSDAERTAAIGTTSRRPTRLIRRLAARLALPSLLVLAVTAGVTASPMVASAAPQGPGSAPSARAYGGSAGDGVPALEHVFLIVGENTGYNELNMVRTPYLLGTIRPHSAWLTNYRAVAHNSLANYVALTSGQFTPCEQGDGLPAACHQNVGNLFSQLDRAGLTWTAWMESMPQACALAPSGSAATLNYYHPVHNPAIYFDGVEGAGGIWSSSARSSECLSNDLPTGTTAANDTSALDSALADGAVPNFNLIVPNLCEDGHTACPYSKTDHGRYRQFDDFLRREIPKIESSPAYAHSIIVIVYDEADSSSRQSDGGHVAAAVLGPSVVPGAYGQPATHYSVLRTIEDGFGLPLLGGAATAPALSSIWAP